MDTLQALTITDAKALNAQFLSVRFGENPYRIDPLKTFCVEIPRNADRFEIAMRLERLAGQMRRGAA